MKIIICFCFVSLLSLIKAQEDGTVNTSQGGWFSLGFRSTMNLFTDDGFGIGTGGQFRIQLSNKINTDWFADYISINIDDKIRSDYYHIGWSVLFYPFENKTFHQKISPYILAGHCFDFNKKVEIQNSSNFKQRWGSAVQAGMGAHFHFGERLDLSLTFQYMIHLTSEIRTQYEGEIVHFDRNKTSSLEGHLLSPLTLK